MRPRLTILGGSSPFTVALIDELKAYIGDLPASELVLQGRNEEYLNLLAAYGRHHLEPLGWTVLGDRNMQRSLTGAFLVLHQIRYGGMALRQTGEELCARHKLPADETLGPAALLSGLLMMQPLQRTLAAVKDACPDAWFVNLTNPLSAVTAIAANSGLKRSVGLCELPPYTANRLAQLAGILPERLSWKYSGLNHRGFLHHLSYNGEDLLPVLLKNQEKMIEGIPTTTVGELKAVPLKYFRLMMGDTSGQCGRAAYLGNLRRRIIAELRQAPFSTPASLKERYLDWYPLAVLPALIALSQTQPRRLVVNVANEEGISREVVAAVSNEEIIPEEACPPPSPVLRWLEKFEHHERLFMDALYQPSPGRLLATLSADPTVTPEKAAEVTQELWKIYQQMKEN